jgi:phosphomannomutase/phosphoglucomutase
VPVSEAEKFDIMSTPQDRLDIAWATIAQLYGFRADTAESWGLVWASNTTPGLILRFEDNTTEALDVTRKLFRNCMTALFANLALSCLEGSLNG